MKNKILLTLIVFVCLIMFFSLALYVNFTKMKLNKVELINLCLISLSFLSLSFIASQLKGDVSYVKSLSMNNVKINSEIFLSKSFPLLVISNLIISFSLYLFSVSAGFVSYEIIGVLVSILFLFQAIMMLANYKLNYILMWIVIDSALVLNVFSSLRES